MKKKAFLTYLLILTCLAIAPKPALADVAADLAQAASFAQQGDYDQAVQAYQQIADAAAGTDEGFMAVQNVILQHLREEKLTMARMAYGQLMADYSERADIVDAFEKELGSAFRDSGDYKTALKIYQYLIAARPNSESVTGWRTALIKCYVGLDDDLNARAEQEKLLTDYANHPSLAGVVGDLAFEYHCQEKWSESRELYEYYVANWPQNKDAMRSARYAAKASIKLGDYEKADQAIDSMISSYADNPEISSELTELADDYAREEEYDNARETYQYVVDHWPDDEKAIDAQVAAVRLSILARDTATVESGYDNLITKFSENESLPEALDGVADEYYEARDYEKARDIYQYVVKTWPESDEAMNSQGDVAKLYIEIGDAAKAAEAVEKLKNEFSASPEIVKALEDVGDKYKLNNSSQEAYDLYKYLLQNWPTDVHAIRIQTKAILSQIHLKDLDKANAELSNLLDDFAGNKELAAMVYEVVEEYRYFGYNQEGQSLYEHIHDNLSQDEATDLEIQVGFALQSIRLKDDPNTEAAIDKLIADYNELPSFAESAYDVATQCFHTRNYGQAIRLWKLVFKNKHLLQRHNDEMPYLLAKCHEQLEEYTEAIEYYIMAVEDYRQGPYAWRVSYELARLMMDLEDYDNAIYWFNRQRELYPDIKRTAHKSLEWQGNIYFRYRQDYQKAAEIYEQCLESVPNRSAADSEMYNLSICYEKLGDNDKAIKVLDEALRLYPGCRLESAIAKRIGELKEDQ